MTTRWWREAVVRWLGGAIATHLLAAPLVLVVAQCVSGRCTTSMVNAAVGFVVFFTLPVLAAFSLLAVPVLAWYARRVRARPELEASRLLVVRNCLLLVPAIVLVPTVVLFATGGAATRRGVETGLLVMPWVVCFVNLVVPRFAIRSLRRGTWPGPA